MTTGSFPIDPGRRKALIILQEHDIEKCAYEPGAAQSLLDQEAYVLQFPLRPQGDIPVVLQNILDSDLVRPGNMLVQSPYDVDTYEEAAIAPQRFAIAKHMYFSILCKHLGAKEVTVEQIELRTVLGKSTFSVKGERHSISGQVSIEAEELEKFGTQMHLRDAFKGGPADIGEAERLLRRTKLLADQNMRALIDMRRDGENQLKKRTLVLSLSSEAKSNLNVVGRINVPSFVKLSADYANTVKEQRDYQLTVTVRF